MAVPLTRNAFAENRPDLFVVLSKRSENVLFSFFLYKTTKRYSLRKIFAVLSVILRLQKRGTEFLGNDLLLLLLLLLLHHLFLWSLSPDLRLSLGQTNIRRKPPLNISIIFVRLQSNHQILIKVGEEKLLGMQWHTNPFDESEDEDTCKL